MTIVHYVESYIKSVCMGEVEERGWCGGWGRTGHILNSVFFLL